MERPGYLPLALTLDYTHPLGALAPYFDGLREGRAMATRSPVTGRIWFPPRLLCPESGEEAEWCTLTGSGRIKHLTNGPSTLPFTADAPADTCFAVIAMDGADNCAIGRVLGTGPFRAGDAVALTPSDRPVGHPAQHLCFRHEP